MELKKVADAEGHPVYQARWPEGNAVVAQLDNEVHVEWLWVRPELRSTGRGRSMLSDIRKHFSLPIRPITVLEAAFPFWAKVAEEGLALEPDFIY